MEPWKTGIRSELERSRAARARGNEGQARVCARRAAGIAIREYFWRKGEMVTSTSAMDLLGILSQDPSLSHDLRRIVEHMIMRVDKNFRLPEDIDLLADAQRLCSLLVPDWETD